VGSTGDGNREDFLHEDFGHRCKDMAPSAGSQPMGDRNALGMQEK